MTKFEGAARESGRARCRQPGGGKLDAVETGELPVAKVVERDARPKVKRAAVRFGSALFAAIFAMWIEPIACVAAGAVPLRIVEGRGPGLFDAGAVLVLGFVGFVLVRRIVRPSMLDSGPSTSWVHAVFDLLWAALGYLILTDVSWMPNPTHRESTFAFGLGFTIVAATLFILRVVFHARTRDLE
jgi:hypothetical protein